MNITGIIHIGAHYGEELNDYINHGVQEIVLFEPLSKTFDVLEKNCKDLNANIQAYNVALGSSEGKATMYLSDNESQSSSILKPKTHIEEMPWINFSGTEEVEVTTLDSYNIEGFNFNYFFPDYSIDVERSLVYTVASLEQIGDKHTEILNFLLTKKPDICIHFEPIHEVLDENNLLDYLTIKYFEKRNYLKNYLTSLQKLQEENKVEILDVNRLYYGSKFIEGHTVIIWKPI